MYRQFYGLRERPFDLTPNPRFLVLTNGHREALSNLGYGIESRKGMTLLLGEAGAGKTTIIRAALERQVGRVHTVYLHNPALTRDEFTEMLGSMFQLSEAARTSKTAMLLELEQLLTERDRRGETTVLVIDEAQTLSLELLEEVRLLANIESLNAKLLSVVLAGQPELADRLNDPELRQLKQRVALRCELRPLTLYEAFGYLAGRIATAGGDGAEIFTREAAVLIHERARGLPRTMSVIADNALVTGFALNLRPITRQVIDEVCRDFDLLPPPPVKTAPTQPVPPAAAPPRGLDHDATTVLTTTVPGPTPMAAGAPPPVPASDTRLLTIDPTPHRPQAGRSSPAGPASTSSTRAEDDLQRERGRGRQFGSFTRKLVGYFGFLRQA
jgi:type II secretory pathway predicted ATPase ExeA